MKSIGELKGKNCIFFGANGSIGRELCKNLAKIQLNLGLVDLSPRDSTSLAKELESIGVKSTSFMVTPGDDASFEEAVKEIKKYLGDVDYLICSYYFEDDEDGEFDMNKLSMNKWDAVLENWVDSYFFMMKGTLPYMLRNKRGKIIFVNLTSGYTGEGEGEGQLVGESSMYYSVCSSAITGAMTSIAREIIPLGIKVNGVALCPSCKANDDRILNTVVFLLSDLSYYTCGQIIRLY